MLYLFVMAAELYVQAASQAAAAQTLKLCGANLFIVSQTANTRNAFRKLQFTGTLQTVTLVIT